MLRSELGEFLRAARARVDPADVNLPSVGVRRVAGLRREEVASLAGVSVDYYTRLEQGRERTPSGQVVDAIGRALQLPTDAREHMLRLAGVIPSTIRSELSEQLMPGMLELLDSLHEVGAYVANRCLDILALNQRARLLLAPFGEVDNIARLTFCNPRSKEILADWRIAAENVVQTLRLAAGYEPRTELDALVAELSAASSEFQELWHANRPLGRTRLINGINHKEYGRLSWTAMAFDVHGSPGQQLVLLFGERGETGAPSWAVLDETPSSSRTSAV